MKKLAITLLLIATSLMSGCMQRNNLPQMSPAQSEMEYKKSIINAYQVESKKCQDNLRNSDTNKKVASAVNIVDSDVLFVRDDSPNKISLMSSNAKISEPQKKALLEYLSANQECRNIVKERLHSFQALSLSYENFFGEMDIVYANLISKKITIGQANQERAKLMTKGKTDYANGIAALNNQYSQQINQENQVRQAEDMQRRAIASQYLMNLQNINAQQQINYQNQLNNNRPVNTNCTRYGNQVNCTSQ